MLTALTAWQKVTVIVKVLVLCFYAKIHENCSLFVERQLATLPCTHMREFIEIEDGGHGGLNIQDFGDLVMKNRTYSLKAYLWKTSVFVLHTVLSIGKPFER